MVLRPRREVWVVPCVVANLVAVLGGAEHDGWMRKGETSGDEDGCMDAAFTQQSKELLGALRFDVGIEGERKVGASANDRVEVGDRQHGGCGCQQRAHGNRKKHGTIVSNGGRAV